MALYGNRSIPSLLGVLFLLCSGAAIAQSSNQSVRVAIDVKPGDTPTIIQPKRQGMLPVAILTTQEFDVARVDPASVQFGPTGTEAFAFRFASADVNNDGEEDLLLLFRMQDLKLECRDILLQLRGKTTDGLEIQGEEAVQMEGCR